MTTANMTLETGLGLKHKGAPAIVFQPLATADFKQIVSETEELLPARPRTPAPRSRPTTTSTATAG